MSTTPSLAQFQATILQAIAAGQQAGEKCFLQLKAAKPNTDMIDECGLAYIVLTMDGRTAWGRFIKSLATSPFTKATVSYDRCLRCHTLHLHGLGGGQDASVATAEQLAAWAVLQREYPDLEGYVDSRSP